MSAAITRRLDQLHLNVPIHVTVSPAPNDADLRYGTTPLPGESDSPIDEAIALAIAETPGPATLPGAPVERAKRLGDAVAALFVFPGRSAGPKNNGESRLPGDLVVVTPVGSGVGGQAAWMGSKRTVNPSALAWRTIRRMARSGSSRAK